MRQPATLQRNRRARQVHRGLAIGEFSRGIAQRGLYQPLQHIERSGGFGVSRQYRRATTSDGWRKVPWLASASGKQ